jgi:hypothetical protein
MKGLTYKQERALKLVEFFIPGWVNWDSPFSKYYDPYTNIYPQQSKNGITAEDGYFMFTERGKMPAEVNNLKRFKQLYWGHKWMATQVKIWKQDTPVVGRLFEEDFSPEEKHIWEFYQREVLGGKPDHYRDERYN